MLIEQPVAEQQLNYLNRLLEREFRGYLKVSPVVTVSLLPSHKMILKGEAAEGYFENGAIVLNDTLRRDRALMVMAHELGHAWHFSRHSDPDVVSDFLAEGFAEWVSYRLMKRAGLTEYCSQLKENPDPLYGGACRWFLHLEEQFGTQAVIDIMTDWINEDGVKLSPNSPSGTKPR